MSASGIAARMLALLVIVLPMPLHAAPETLRLETESLNAVELEAFEPWPDAFVISGVSEHAEKELYRGEFVASLYEAKPLVLDISIPYSIDEFVWVLDGELILTHVEGRSETFVAGDTLLVPRGWKGTWEMRGNFREFVVIETRANDSENWLEMLGQTIASWFQDVPQVVPLKAEQPKEAAGTERLYEGQFVMEVRSSPPTTVEISAPHPHDEFVWVLAGELVLTPKGGEAVTYGPSEGVVVPKGFIGTREARSNYRGLIIIETEAMNRVHGSNA
jgi:uncharacterized cupin superfamily protein